MMTLQLIADKREPPLLIHYLKELGVEVSLETLTVGDFYPGEEVIVERKTGQDYVASIVDKRLFEQAKRMTEVADIPIIILEDFNSAFSSPTWKERKKQVFGSIAYLALRLRIQLIPTTSMLETALVLERLCSWVQEEKQDPLLSRSAKKTWSIEEKQAFFLQGLPAIGPKLANRLLSSFGTPYEVLKQIENTKLLFTRTGRVKGIEGPLKKIEGVGPKLVLQWKEVLNGNQYKI